VEVGVRLVDEAVALEVTVPDLGGATIDSSSASPSGSRRMPRHVFGTDIVKVCLLSAPTTPTTISSPTQIDTTNSPICAVVTSSGNYCVLAGTNRPVGQIDIVIAGMQLVREIVHA